jgi:hypothetical protein
VVAVLTPDENECVQISDDAENARQSNADKHGSERKEPIKRRPIDYVEKFNAEVYRVRTPQSQQLD